MKKLIFLLLIILSMPIKAQFYFKNGKVTIGADTLRGNNDTLWFVNKHTGSTCYFRTKNDSLFFSDINGDRYIGGGSGFQSGSLFAASSGSAVPYLNKASKPSLESFYWNNFYLSIDTSLEANAVDTYALIGNSYSGSGVFATSVVGEGSFSVSQNGPGSVSTSNYGIGSQSFTAYGHAHAVIGENGDSVVYEKDGGFKIYDDSQEAISYFRDYQIAGEEPEGYEYGLKMKRLILDDGIQNKTGFRENGYIDYYLNNQIVGSLGMGGYGNTWIRYAKIAGNTKLFNLDTLKLSLVSSSDTIFRTNKYSTRVKSLYIDPSYVPTTVQPGQIAWNSSDGTFDMGLYDGCTMQAGQELPIRVQNLTGSTITEGMLVYVYASGGSIPRIQLADNRYSTTAYMMIGQTTTSLTHGGYGYVTRLGKVHNMSNAGYEGKDYYLGQSGLKTYTKPTNAHIIRAGWVPYAHSSTGIDYVDIVKETATNFAVYDYDASDGHIIDTTGMYTRKSNVTTFAYNNDSTNLRVAATKWHRTDTINSNVANVWKNVKFNLNVADETTYGITANSDTTGFIATTSGLLRMSGCGHWHWSGAPGTVSKMYIRVTVNGTEKRCLQANDTKTSTAGDNGILPYSGTVRVNPGDLIRVQYRVDNVGMDFVGDPIFDSPIAFSMNLFKISK